MMFKSKNEGGFTIVELIVAMSIFVVLLTVAVGAFVKIVRAQRSLVHRMAVNNNTGVVLEQIAREVRTGYFFCGDGTSVCDESTSSISFTNHKGEDVTYFLDGDVIKRTDDEGTVKISASNVSVKDLNFRVVQADSSICSPWRVTIRMTVGSEKTDVKRDIKLQTTVSSRVLPAEAPGLPQEIIDDCQ